MGMRMTQASANRVLAKLTKAEKAVDEAVVEAFAEAGTLAVNGIRSGEMSNWQDDTGALRSSIGFVVCHKGRIIKSSGFDTVLNGAEGSEKGRKLCETLAVEYSRYNFVLIVVAGEEYAVYVEAVESRVVLAGGQLFIEKNIIRMLQDKINQAIRKL